MCDGCDSFPYGCGSPVCLTGKENEDEKLGSYKGDNLTNSGSVNGFGKLSQEQQEEIRIIVDKFYIKWSKHLKL